MDGNECRRSLGAAQDLIAPLGLVKVKPRKD